MSLLQPILSRLQPTADLLDSEGSADHRQTSTLSAGAIPPKTTSLPCCASWYRENLRRCNEAMLHYEWAWLHGRIDALEHFVGRERRNHAAASDAVQRCEQMLSESGLFRTLLEEEFTARGLQPSAPRADVVPSEEAWEITSQKVKEDWGIL